MEEWYNLKGNFVLIKSEIHETQELNNHWFIHSDARAF